MRNNKFDILNGLDNSNDNIEEVEVSNEEKEALKIKMRTIIRKENKKKKKIRNKIIAASVSCIMLGSFVLNSESVIASMNNIGKKIESYFGKEEGTLKSYKDEVLKSVEDKGIKFSLNEIMLNDEELVVSMMIDYSNFDFESISIKKNKENKVSVYPNTGIEITLDGEKVNISGMGGEYDYDSENKVTNAFMSFDMNGAELDKDYNIKVNLEQIVVKERFKEEKLVEGNWTLDSNFSGKKLKNEVEVIELNETIELEEYFYQNYILNEVRKTPASIVVKYNQEKPYRIRNKGEKVNILELMFFDENEEKLEFLSRGGSSETGFSYEYKGDKELTKINVIPVVYEERNALLNLLGMPLKEKILNEKAIIIDLTH